MARRIFRLQGRVAWADGTPAAGVLTSIVDADPDFDDLLGAGHTADDGSFRVSFTAESFRQEPAETEETPDIYVVVAVVEASRNKPVLRASFPHLRFDAVEDLGVLTLPIGPGEPAPEKPGFTAMPGASKRVRRVHLDDDLVAGITDEVAPIVETITGWPRLLDGVRFVIEDDFTRVDRRRVARALGRTEDDPLVVEHAPRSGVGCETSFLALWEPHDRIIYLHRPLLERQSLDMLRMTVGHELVHVGQFREHAEIASTHAAISAEMVHRQAGLPHPDRFDAAAIFAFQANIEGYAQYVETKFLARIYTCSRQIFDMQSVAAAQLAMRRKMFAAKQRSDLGLGAYFEPHKVSANIGPHATTITKSGQYEAGCAAYLALTPGSEPARFDPALRPAPVLDQSAFAELAVAALAGCAASQMSVGTLFAAGGGGVEQNVEAAAHYFRLAADQGHSLAAYNLALCLEEGNPERHQRMMQAADWGLPEAVFDVALTYAKRKDETNTPMWALRAAETGAPDGAALWGATLLDGFGVEPDPVGALAWLEKAAGAGSMMGMHTLVRIYREGLGIKPDLIMARLWEKRLEKAQKASQAEKAEKAKAAKPSSSRT